MPERHSSERRFAEFYRLYIGDFRADVPLYLDLAAKYPGPVLEVGCGTGRVTAHLAAAGQEVHAIDVSRAMLEVARDQLRPWWSHTHLHDFDLRQRAVGQRFHVALVTLHAFNYLIDVVEQRLFLRHLRESMRGPGVVAVDLFWPLSVVRPETHGRWRAIDRIVDGHRLVVRDRREMLTPLLERRTQVFRVDRAPEEEMVTHRRFVTGSAIGALLAEAGFERIRWIPAYDPSRERPMADAERPAGPFLVLAEL